MSKNQVEVEITESVHEVRVSSAGEVIDGKSFAGVLLIYLNQDERIVRAALAKDQIAKALPILGRYYAAHGFREGAYTTGGVTQNMDAAYLSTDTVASTIQFTVTGQELLDSGLSVTRTGPAGSSFAYLGGARITKN